MARLTPLLALLAAGSALTNADQIPLVPTSSAGVEVTIPANAIEPIPALGFGTWNIRIAPQNTTDSVAAAIEAGYRHIDCAVVYGNQVDVGKGIKKGLEKAGLKREDIWVTSKLWNDHHGSPDNVAAGLNKTLEELGVGYLDLYLMHWPVGSSSRGSASEYDYVTTWRSMEELLPLGTVRHIGVSNFSPVQLRTLIDRSHTKPYAHQMELHPYLQQGWWVEAHQKEGIYVTAYSPLGNMNPIYHGNALQRAWNWITSWFSWFIHLLVTPKTADSPPPLVKNEVLQVIGEKRGCTAAQVALAWGIARGTKVIPKSTHVQWIEENFGSLGCNLEKEDMEEIKDVGEKYLTRFNNPSKGWGVKLFEGLDGVPY